MDDYLKLGITIFIRNLSKEVFFDIIMIEKVM